MDNPSNFIIVTLPRSGSYHLVSLLDSADDIVCHGEIFKTDYIELRKFHLDKLKLDKADVAKRDADRVAFAQSLRRINKLKHVGFKIFPGHVNKDQGFNNSLMNSPAWKKIFLFRNPLYSYASLMRAKQTGVWVLTEGSQHPEDKLNAKIEFSKEEFEQHLSTCKWFESICARTEKVPGNQVFLAHYNKLGDTEHLRDMLQFIGSKSKADTLKSDKQRQFSARFEDGFTNWPQFEAYLREHKLLQLVEDGRE